MPATDSPPSRRIVLVLLAGFLKSDRIFSGFRVIKGNFQAHFVRYIDPMDVNAPSLETRTQAIFIVLIVLGLLIPRQVRCAESNMSSPAVNTPKYELYGQVRIGSKQKSRQAYAFVGLTGNQHPYSSSSWTSYGGRFRFRNLDPGSYTLLTEVNRRSEHRMTVEISPAMADEKGRILQVIILDPTSFHSLRRKPQVISWRELSVSPKARSEYAEADKSLLKGQIENGIHYLERAIKIAPQFISALNRLGTVYYFRKEYSKAEQVFRRALTEDPKAFEPLINLGGTLLSAGKPEEALPYNLKAFEARSSDALASAQLGLNFVALHDDDRAVTYLVRTKQLDQLHFTQPQLVLAGIYQRKGQPEPALRELEEFIQLHPDSSEAKDIQRQIAQIKSRN